jgi:putative ABC transport system permease protein
VDESFFDTFGIELVAGRTFSSGMQGALSPGSRQTEFVINEAAAKQFGWTDPVGKQIEWVGVGSGTVVGVVKDYHVTSLKDRIAPNAFVRFPPLFVWIAVQVKDADLSQTLPFLEQTWKQFAPDQPFDYTLLEDSIQRNAYWTERRLMKVTGHASVLAVLIACLGLFGLSAFNTHQRIREIGIRKVLGASVSHLVVLLSRDLLLLVGVANLVAWPVAWYAVSAWLEQYPYRAAPGLSIFAGSGIIAVLIALATVSGQALRAAQADPVTALHSE